MTTRVVNRAAGDSFDVYIGRPSKWGNPFRIGPDGTREEVIARYEEWILGQAKLLAALPELQGKRLGCYCAPLPCHGDVLARLADGFHEYAAARAEANEAQAQFVERLGAKAARIAESLSGELGGDLHVEFDDRPLEGA